MTIEKARELWGYVMLETWGTEWRELSTTQKDAIVADYGEAVADDGCQPYEYRRRIGSGNLYQYARTLIAQHPKYDFSAELDGVTWEPQDKAETIHAIEHNRGILHGRSATCTDWIRLETATGKHVSGSRDWDTNVWTLRISMGWEQFVGGGTEWQ